MEITDPEASKLLKESSTTKMSEQSELSETDRDDPPYSPGSAVRTRLRGRPRKYEDPDMEKIPSHLVEGYRILQHIMRISKYFQQDPNPKDKGMYDYYEVIKQPICFDEIKRKFVSKEYTQLPEFVYDVRLLLLNCYRFFGPNSKQTKRALHVEEMFEKRLALLSEEQRELCSLEATHGKLENVEENAVAVTVEGESCFESKLLKSVEKEKACRIMERKQKLLGEQQTQTEGKEKDLLLWETQTLFTQSDYEMMKHMWEIPVIGHFVSLAIYQLNIQRISIYEIERMFLMPQASKSLCRLMTTLLSSPLTRLKIHIKPSMPYKLWSKKLAQKVSGWYKLYVKSNSDPQIVFEKLGIEHQFWKMFGNFNLLEEHEFHELTFHQRVFLVKTLCDYVLQNHKLIRDTIAEMTEEFGICLGADHTGAKYIYFPQFLNLDIRIYKQNLDPKTWVDRDVDHEIKSEKKKCHSKLNRKRHKRRKAWKLGKIAKRVSHYRSVSKRKEASHIISLNLQNEVNDIKDGQTDSLKSVQTQLRIEDKDLETGELKFKTMLLDSENGLDNQINLSDSVCHHEQLSTRTDDVKTTKSESTIGEHHELVKLVLVKNENEYIMKNCDELKTESVMDSVNKEEQKEKHTLYCAKWLEPDPEDFELVADSVEGVRELLDKFCDDDVELIQRLNNSKKGKSNRPICEVKLARRLATLIGDLEALELKLVRERKKTRVKLYEEWQDFLNRSSDFVDPDESFWLNEKELIESHDGEAPGTPNDIQSDIASLEMANLPQTPNAEFLQIPDRDSLDALAAGGMTLRHRRIENLPNQELKEFFSSDTEDQSSEDEGDNWEMPKSRKRKRTKQLKCTPSNQSSKKKDSEQKNGAHEDCAKTTKPEDPDIEIVDYVEKSPARKLVTASTLRVKKRLFFQSEANRQLEWEKNRQKLVNMVYSESAKDLKTTSPKTKIIMDSSNKILLDNSGIISVPSTNSNQALSNLQGRKLNDIIREGKVVKGKAVITGVIGVEMESSKSPKQTSVSLQPTGVQVAANVNFGVVQASHNTNTNAVLNSGVTSTESVNANLVVSQPSSDMNDSISNITNSYSSNIDSVSPSKNIPTASRLPQNVSQIEEVIVLSDESDNDIEFIDMVYNPKLDKNLVAQNKPHKTSLLQADESMLHILPGQPNILKRQHSVNPEVSVRQGQGNSSHASGQITVAQNLIDVTSPQYRKNTYAVKHSSPIQCSSQNIALKQISNSMISMPEIKMGNSQRNNIFTPKKSCISASSSPTLMYQADRVCDSTLDVSPRSSACQPGKTIIRGNMIISPRSAVSKPRTPECSTVVGGHTIISPGSSVPQPRTPGCSTVVKGNTIISPGSGVPQPRTPGCITVIRGNTIISPGSGVPQPRTPGCNTIVRGNTIISPGSHVPQPRTPGCSTAVRGNMVSPVVSPSSSVVRGNVIPSRNPGITMSSPVMPSTNIIRGNTVISPVSNMSLPQNPAVYRQVNPFSTPVKSPLSYPRATVQRPVNSLDVVPRIGIDQGHISGGSDMQLITPPRSQPHGVSQNSSPAAITSLTQQGSALQRLATPSKHPIASASVNSGVKTTARLVVVPGDEHTGSNYGLIFPNGNRVILSPKQVADIRAANGGCLPTNVGW